MPRLGAFTLVTSGLIRVGAYKVGNASCIRDRTYAAATAMTLPQLAIGHDRWQWTASASPLQTLLRCSLSPGPGPTGVSKLHLTYGCLTRVE